jgi:hypothetical protein
MDHFQAAALYGNPQHTQRKAAVPRPYPLYMSVGEDQKVLNSVPKIKRVDLHTLSLLAFGDGWRTEGDTRVRNFAGTVPTSQAETETTSGNFVM